MKSVLILKILARVKTLESSSLLSPGELQHSYNYPPVSESTGVILPSSFLCKGTNRSLKFCCALRMCVRGVFVYIHRGVYVSCVLHDEASDSQTSDSISETRAVSTSIPYLLLSDF